MLHVTSRARLELHSILMSRNDPPPEPSVGFRIVAEPRDTGAERPNLGLVLDAPREGDQVVRFQERTVLLIDPVLEAVEDLTLDAVETPEGVQLTLRTAPPS